MYNTYNEYEGYEDEDYKSVDEVLYNLEREDNCEPTVIDTITEQDEDTGEFRETKVYNCNSCTNYNCQFFYEI